jgi:hypothetical protein
MEEFHLLEYNTTLSNESQPTFRRNISLPSSSVEEKPKKESSMTQPASSVLLAACFMLLSFFLKMEITCY